jgi:hypothetical protein
MGLKGAGLEPGMGLKGAGLEPGMGLKGAGLEPALTGVFHGLPEIVRQFKTFSARKINVLRNKPGTPVWKRNYYETIVRSEKELTNIRLYITNNPVRAGSKPARGLKPARGPKPTREDNHNPVRAGSKPAPLLTQKPAPTTVEIAGMFAIDGIPSVISPIGSGHINDSYLITCTGGSKTSPCGYVLQRINHQIFKDIPRLMHNIDLVTRHMRKKSKTHSCNMFMQVLELIATHTGELFHTDNDGNFWRMYFHIPGSRSYDRIDNPMLAYEGGKAFGQFQALAAGIDPEGLAITIPRFHDITWRLEQFDEAIEHDIADRVSRTGAKRSSAKPIPDEIRFVRERAQEMHTIHRLMESGQLPVRVTHNDTKFNNILFNSEDKAICIVDLDTVMPGTVLYDFGDAIRTGASTADEDEPNLSKVRIDLRLFEAYARGFIETAGASLTPVELGQLAFSAKFMTFIIGLRFLTDHINGDTYYKIHHPGHNLQRARCQFRLLESIENEFDRMREVVERFAEK